MLLWHQPHLDPHPPGVQGSWAGLEPNLCLWDTQGQGQGAQRLKDHCLLCVHHCDFCHCPHTPDTTASKQANCPLCSHRNCLPAHSNNTAGNNLCPKGNIPNRCYPKTCTSQLYYETWQAMCILWLRYRQVCSAALSFALVRSHWYPWLNEMLLPFTDTLCTAADVLTVQRSQWRGQLELLKYHNQFDWVKQERQKGSLKLKPNSFCMEAQTSFCNCTNLTHAVSILAMPYSATNAGEEYECGSGFQFERSAQWDMYRDSRPEGAVCPLHWLPHCTHSLIHQTLLVLMNLTISVICLSVSLLYIANILYRQGSHDHLCLQKLCKATHCGIWHALIHCHTQFWTSLRNPTLMLKYRQWTRPCLSHSRVSYRVMIWTLHGR